MRQLPKEQQGEQKRRLPPIMPRAAVQPITGGIAPGTAPTSVLTLLKRFKGV